MSIQRLTAGYLGNTAELPKESPHVYVGESQNLEAYRSLFFQYPSSDTTIPLLWKFFKASVTRSRSAEKSPVTSIPAIELPRR
ncbi:MULTISPECIES: hypothetical protein [Nostocales]|uniref:Uncharacterized protein n=2 Tax=Nostocales TaxID=1161 RepID=A0A8S9T2K4_9CYAN|nr:hypothetical protein [Tolypothrix bouteillei]KAF3886660.1 hypothetical protein DA73_0400015115 [Tolypothrix bouteillei VB521301]